MTRKESETREQLARGPLSGVISLALIGAKARAQRLDETARIVAAARTSKARVRKIKGM